MPPIILLALLWTCFTRTMPFQRQHVCLFRGIISLNWIKQHQVKKSCSCHPSLYSSELISRKRSKWLFCKISGGVPELFARMRGRWTPGFWTAGSIFMSRLYGLFPFERAVRSERTSSLSCHGEGACTVLVLFSGNSISLKCLPAV